MVRKQARGAGTKAKSNGSLDRWNTYDDIPDNTQDAFHRQQDRIALGDIDDKAKENDDDEYSALGGNRGVLDVDEESMESDAEDFEEEDDEEEEEEEDEIEDEDYQTRKASFTKSKAASSEEEDDDDDDDDDEDEKDQDDAPTGGWGPNKQSYYSTNDLDDLSSDSEMDEEERRDMEVREVKRLHAKSRQGLTEDDFGLGQDTLRLEGSSAAREARRKDFDAEALAIAKPSTETFDITSLDAVQRAQLISKVQKSTPETLALVGEYVDIIEDIGHVSKRLKKVMQLDTREEIVGLCGLHHQILLTYAANLAFYFYLRATPSYASNPRKLASHGVIDRLAKLKNGLQLLDSFGFSADDNEEQSESEDESIEGDEDEENREPATNFLYRPEMLGGIDEEDDISLGSLEEDELKQLDREEMESEAASKRSKPANREKVEKVDKTEKKKQKKQKAKKVAAPLASVANVQDEDDTLGTSKKRKKASNKPAASATTDAEAFNAFGEPTQLTASDSADKEARRRSLKFYTGQIDAKDARRAGGSGLGGDSDIPYRDRERSRMAVADANARKSASFNRQVDRNLNGDEWGEEDSRDWKDVMDVERSHGKKGGEELGGDDDVDYYDLVASGKKSAKRAKKDEYDEMKASQRVAPDDSLEEGEHRGISRTIEKNRGLTPRRPKANRNPRVKKRIRFEKAQKKLSSKGPVYKGGQGALQGGYSGEQSGINSNVVKSRQFA